ncbi:conserved hypothetical protein [uncultured Desulfobacterium sp.]|uniref:PIN domain-containing protein n=1 Tax=uncultured Desulfobacterium sp. TaxID=201089 RepID=A0A445N2F8_9BACT|nr:conserved hypothetical protein [uncultured Desulfobacterium sp.]
MIIDTGVVISAFAFGGTPKKSLTKAIEDARIFVSPPLLNEYRYVPLELLAKNKIDKDQFKALISGIAAFVSKAVVVFPKEKLFVCRDPQDNIVLECCLQAEADILITGDKDLLEIKNLPFRLNILTPRMYLKKA